jgi:Tfp pilus assembly protein PilV
MSHSHTHKKSAGFSLVEILVACSIITASILAFMLIAQKGLQLSRVGLSSTQAAFLLEEGVEATKSIRDDAWANITALTPGTTYYLSYNTSTNKWLLSTTPSVIDSTFTRTVVLADVSRDANDDIAATGTNDALTKKVTVTVSFPGANAATISKSISLYITKIFQ